MNYRHQYHAGNFADVVKHMVQCQILKKLTEKESPFFVLDTHAGKGFYDLTTDEAQKTKEFQNGIECLYGKEVENPIVKEYLQRIQSFNENQNQLRYYPGSPKISESYLRPSDRMALAELHPEDCYSLGQIFSYGAQVNVVCENGFQTLKALLPPKEKRGFIMIDPPFEKLNECQYIVQGLKQGLKRFAHGVYLIWFPLKLKSPVSFLKDMLLTLPLPKTLWIEFYRYSPYSPHGLNGSGMIVINPPWHLDEALQGSFSFLLRLFEADQEGSFSINWLVAEKE